ncbi:MAG: hypothetical protein J6I80_01790, partial [Clostridia bacterium]|nr:hypothetical protein [Clostridia bacterium]
MAKIQSKAKRVLAITIALMMVLGACFTGMVTASAESLATGLTAVATTATNGYSSSATNSAFADIEGGGIAYSTTGMGAYRPYLHNQGIVGFPGGGVRLQFDGFVSTSPETMADQRGYQSILIVLSNAGSNAGEACRLRSANVSGFIIDAYNGNVDYVLGVDGSQSSHTLVQRVIENSDLIKYANITNVPFDITFYHNADGDIVVEVFVEGNNETDLVSGVLDAEKFASAKNLGRINTFFSISSVDCNNNAGKHTMSFNYYGYSTLEMIPEFAADLTGTAYFEQDTANDMQPTADSNIGGYAVTNARKWGVVGGLLGGGFRYAMFQHAGLGPAWYKTNLGGYDGNWELQFANYIAIGDATYTSGEETVTNPNFGKFAINLFSTAESRIMAKSVFIAFDTIAGEVYLAKGADTITATNGDGRPDETYVTKLATIASGDAFKLANFQGKAFTVRLMQTANKSKVELAVVVDGEKYAATIDKSLFQTGGANAITASAAFAAISALYSLPTASLNQCSIDFYGHRAITPDYIGESREAAAAVVDNLATTADNIYTSGTPNVISNIEGGGVHYEGIGHYPFQLNTGMDFWPGNGFRLSFANYAELGTDSTKAGYGQFVVFFNYGIRGNTTYGPFWKGGNVGININTVDGQVELVKSDFASLANTQKYVDKVLVENDMFLYDNFAGKPFSYQITQDYDGASTDALVTITVADQSVSFTITYEELSARPEGFTTAFYCPKTTWDGKTSNCNVSFSALLHDGTTASVDFMGYTKGILPAYITDARNNIDVVASLTDTPDGRVNTNATETDVKGGGIYITGTSGYDPYNLTYNFGGWPGDGLKLQFADFVTTNTNDDNAYKFALMLGRTSSSYMQAWKGGNVMLIVDGVAGQVNLVKCYGQQLNWKTVATLIDNDAFLYENFTGKAFSFEFMLSGKKSNEVQVTVEVGNESYVGYIDYNLMMAEYDTDGTDFSSSFDNNGTMTARNFWYPNGSTLNVGFGGMDNDSQCSFYFLGYTDGVTPAYMEEARDNITTVVTSENNAYNSSKSYVTDINGGGVHYEAIGHYPFQLNEGLDRWPGNGFKLQFANYAENSNKTDAEGYRQFVVFFNYGLMNNGNYSAFWKGGNIGLNFNTVDGQLELVKSDMATLGNTKKYVDKVLIEDDMFLYDNFAGTAFSLEVLPAGFNASAIINVTVGDVTKSCFLTYDEFRAVPEGFETTTAFYPTSNVHAVSQCNVSFSALLHDSTVAAVDFFGFTKYDDGELKVGSVNGTAGSQISVPVSATTNAASMTVEVDSEVAINDIVAADGVTLTKEIDGTKAVVNVTSAVTGTNVKLFDVVITAGSEKVYAVDVKATAAVDAEGNALDIAIARGGATVVAVAPNTAEVKYQATEGAYQLGTLGFGTDTADMAALASEDFVAVEFGTVFFTAKMLGDQELQIGTTKAGGSATALTVSKKIGAGEILPAQFVAVLKDKITNEGDTVSDAYRNTTYVARSFVRYLDTTTNTYVVVYGNLKSG